ncbi:uncharacterized protein BO95DRAFT_296257 [Aspergillus brunneoviolaceus CBS 621.78]|uniref:Uncharacterized protein n=1 Tax=Aspergillus brunneoviolaceus CBS 621.78 TaxID=1450534 RepID=A0ACD1FUE7_9EURO|nr:hypothetical protein BO95DRAFT_296257 [Aspergillus brunneoviolaceus CBS 621.78]RAH40579.1 hypothetical protein BO95DRAFT_296257 [Aspergillus brunneoviolaceus CBS 621.78]
MRFHVNSAARPRPSPKPRHTLQHTILRDGESVIQTRIGGPSNLLQQAPSLNDLGVLMGTLLKLSRRTLKRRVAAMKLPPTATETRRFMAFLGASAFVFSSFFFLFPLFSLLSPSFFVVLLARYTLAWSD